MEKPDYSGCTPIIVEYIKYLEGALNGSTRLVNELNLLSDGYASDLEKERLGEAGEDNKNLKYLTGDVNDPNFNMKMILLSKIKDFKALQPTIKSDKPVTKMTKVKEEEEVVPKRRNIQDLVFAK